MGILDEIRNENPKKKFAIKPQVSLGMKFLAVIIGKILQYAMLTTIGYFCWNYVIPTLGGVRLTFWHIFALLVLLEVFINRATGGNSGKYQ